MSIFVLHLGASFSENFYGMKREALSGRFSRKLKLFNLLVLVLGPYIRNKLEALNEKTSIENADGKLPIYVRIQFYPFTLLSE